MLNLDTLNRCNCVLKRAVGEYLCWSLLQQSLGLAARVIRSEVLVLLHLLFDGQKLTLQLGPQIRQGVPDVVGQLLCRSKVRISE